MSALLLPGFANAAATSPPQASYTGNLPDPSIILAGGKYFGYGTQDGGGSYPATGKPSYIQLVQGSGLTSWLAPPSQEALGQLPTWAVPGWTWAPEVIRLPTGQTGRSQYVMYYSARHCGATATPCRSGSGITANNHLCIAAATSASPGGPFTTSSKPLICSSTDSID